MLRLAIVLVFLSPRSHTAHVHNSAPHKPSAADRLFQLYEKLEKLTVAPQLSQKSGLSPHEKLYEKLDRLNSLTPDKILTDEDEELLAAMQLWGMMSPDQLDGVVKDLQSVKGVQDDGKSDRVPDEDSDDWNEPDLADGDYPMDWYPDEDSESGSTSRPVLVTPSAFTRLNSSYIETVVSAIDPIAETKKRPSIMDDSTLTALEKKELLRTIFSNIATVLKTGKCAEPQARWLTVRQLAPAANIVYIPPCVQLHRCAADSGCCYDETEVCAPVAGSYVAIPFYLQKADGDRTMTRMLFFNHTKCACVSRETLQTTLRTRAEPRRQEAREAQDSRESQERQNDWRAASTEEPSLDDDEGTPPPQLRRCTCPTLFLARPVGEDVCTCVCEWADAGRRRDCVSLARGREHFGLRDRVCVDRGACNPPACEFGAYDRAAGRCPLRRYRRLRYHRPTARHGDA